MRLAVCLPCRDHVNTGFAYDLARFTAYWSATHVAKGGALHLFTSAGTLIADQRENLVKEALKVNADWILFLDTDMRFPKDVFDILAKHDAPIVAANYSTRGLPAKPVAFSSPRCDEYVYTTADSKGLEEVYAVGMGVMLIKAEVFKKTPMPWFQIGYAAGTGNFFGEDIHFCHKAAKHGYKTMIDHDLSKIVRHIGTFEYTLDHAEACREDVEAEKRNAA
jgi:GT2 family glycosyltransferase